MIDAALTAAGWLDLVASVILAGGLLYGAIVAEPSKRGVHAVRTAAAALVVALLPFGTETSGHAWLHSRCWGSWHGRRKAEAVSVLSRTLAGRLMGKRSNFERGEADSIRRYGAPKQR